MSSHEPAAAHASRAQVVALCALAFVAGALAALSFAPASQLAGDSSLKTQLLRAPSTQQLAASGLVHCPACLACATLPPASEAPPLLSTCPSPPPLPSACPSSPPPPPLPSACPSSPPLPSVSACPAAASCPAAPASCAAARSCAACPAPSGGCTPLPAPAAAPSVCPSVEAAPSCRPCAAAAGAPAAAGGHDAAYASLTRTQQVDWLYSDDGQSHTAALLLPAGGLAPLTHEAQRAIIAHQHRPAHECAQARFLAGHFLSGAGSQWHVATQWLAVAMATSRIFLWAPGEQWYTNGDVCKPEQLGRFASSWACYFKQPSNCSGWATDGNTDVVSEPVKSPGVDEGFVPPALSARLYAAVADMTPHEAKLWWRAQAVGFLVRPNAQTLAAIRALRRLGRMTRVAAAANGSLAPAPPLEEGAAVYPLPAGTISAHVRHGDKGIEMELQAWERYASAAAALQAHNPLSLRRSLFVSTEDPGVVASAATLPGGPWTALYSDIPRQNSNGHGQMYLASNLMYMHLLQLMMTLEADAAVGTLGSNWNRLIVELRCVWVPKCHTPYVEIGPKKDWETYSWRRLQVEAPA